MKAELLLILLVVTLVAPNAYGQEVKNFGYKLLPEKLVEGTEGILQVYGLQKNIPIPDAIENLIVTSSDQSIVKVLELNTNIDTSITSVKLQTYDSGVAKIAIAAPGYASEEFEIRIYDIKQGEQQLLVKTVPDIFTVNGPSKGYYSVQLADVDSNPTFAKQDTNISLSTSNDEIITIFQNEIVIKEGEYYAVGEFQVNKPGEVSLYAESPNTDPDSSKITVLGATDDDDSIEENYKIQLYVLPNKISNFATSSTFAIVQLQDSDGSPIRASETIPISLKIDYADAVFNDKRTDEINTVNSLVIPPGSTTGYAKLSVKAGLEETYEVSISAEDYLVSDSVKFHTVLTPDIEDPRTKLATIPLLASSSEQLIGVLYPADDKGVSLINIDTVESEINSSNRDVLSISDDRMEIGTGAKLVYGKMGQTKPERLEVTVIGEDKQTVFPQVYGPERNELSLAAEPLIEKIIPKTNFPMAVYMVDVDNASWYFPDTSNVVMIPNEFVKAPVQTISEGQSVSLLSSQSLKEGNTNLEFEANEFTTIINLNLGETRPAKIELAYPDHLLSGMKNTLALQILDEGDNPVFASKDIELKLAANDNSITMPQTITIPKGEYSVLFDIIPEKPLETEISVLASDFPLSKFTVNTVETNLSLIISTVNSIVAGEVFDLVLDAKILEVPLSNVVVNWDIQGAEIQQISQTTDANGKIKITLVAQDTDMISVKATTQEYDQISISKQITITKPRESPVVTTVSKNPIEENMGFILIPGVLVGSSILLRKRSLLEPLAERIPVLERALDKIDELFERLEITEKFETIKEKIPILRER